MSNKTDTGKLGLTACIAMLAGGCIGSSIFSLSGMTMYYVGPAAILSWIIAAGVFLTVYLRGNWLRSRIAQCGMEPEKT